MKKLDYFDAIRFLSKYVRKHRSNFFMFYLGWLLDAVLVVVSPILFGVMIDEIVYYQNIGTFFNIALFFVFLIVFSCILYFFIYAQHGYLMNMYTLNIRRDIFEHLQVCEAQYLSSASTGDILSLLNNYSDECMHFVVRNIIHHVNNILKIVSVGIFLILINWKIGLFALLIAPVTVWVNAKFGKKIRQYGDRQRENYAVYISWAYEILTALRDIRMLGAQRKTENTFEEHHKNMFNVNIKSSISILNAQNILSFVSLIVQLGIFAFAGYLAATGNITIGLVTVIVTYYAVLTQTIGFVSQNYLNAQERISYIQRIYDFMHTPIEDIGKDKKDIDITNGHIVLRGIHFAYEMGTTVFKGLNLEIRSGERFALAGKSGCGKTTLAYMLIGFYKPDSGLIEIDGQKLSECSLTSIRSNIGLIQQDVLIFDGTIKENILLGNPKATQIEIENACEQAGLGSLIDTLPHGIETIIGTSGIGLSGGQKQRIAIARIYLKNPQIIIFDEATSSLDSEAGEAIFEAWENVLQGRTSIVIAHNKRSVMLCDRVAIIQDGQIIETGVSSEMAQNSYAFKSLFTNKENCIQQVETV